MAIQRASRWPELFDLTLDIFDRLQSATGINPAWSFGGGTALMLQIDHRESHDVDIFLDDMQVLPYLNPETQGYALSQLPSTYDTNGSTSLKLVYEGLGEIDFICCSAITKAAYCRHQICGRDVQLETPAEIIAKKVYFRGGMLQPRDMFDLAAVERSMGPDYVIDALRQCGQGACGRALAIVERVSPEFVERINSQLMYRQACSDLVALSQASSRKLLKAAMA